MQNSLCVEVLRSPILSALLHGTRVVGVSESLQRHRPTRNGITEVLQRAPPIFDWAAITLGLGIGPHSSYCSVLQCEVTHFTLILYFETFLRAVVLFSYYQ